MIMQDGEGNEIDFKIPAKKDALGEALDDALARITKEIYKSMSIPASYLSEETFIETVEDLMKSTETLRVHCKYCQCNKCKPV